MSEKKFSTEVKDAITLADFIAEKRGHKYIGPTHLLIGVVQNENSLATRVLENLAVDTTALLASLEDNFDPKNTLSENTISKLPLNDQADRVLKVAFLEAKMLKDTDIQPEHLVLSILRNKQLPATILLRQFEVEYDIYKAELDYLRDENDFSEMADDKIILQRGNDYRYSGEIFSLQETNLSSTVSHNIPIEVFTGNELLNLKTKLLQKNPSNLLLIDDAPLNGNIALRHLCQAIKNDAAFRLHSRSTFYSLIGTGTRPRHQKQRCFTGDDQSGL